MRKKNFYIASSSWRCIFDKSERRQQDSRALDAIPAKDFVQLMAVCWMVAFGGAAATSVDDSLKELREMSSRSWLFSTTSSTVGLSEILLSRFMFVCVCGCLLLWEQTPPRIGARYSREYLSLSLQESLSVHSSLFNNDSMALLKEDKKIKYLSISSYLRKSYESVVETKYRLP